MKYDSQKIGRLILELGDILLCNGGEVSRVEDTVYRIGKAYGFKSVDCLTIMNAIILSVVDEEGESFTQIKRVLEINKNMEKVRLCNALSRELCRNPLPEEEFEKRVYDIEHSKGYGRLATCLIYVLTASSMTVFFGGGLLDGVAAMLSAVMLYFASRFMSFARIQNFVTSYIEAFCVGSMISLLIALGIGHRYELISMGNIMLMISGSGLMTSVNDMINNDLLSGIMGFVSAVIGAFAIALGFVTAAMIFM